MLNLIDARAWRWRGLFERGELAVRSALVPVLGYKLPAPAVWQIETRLGVEKGTAKNIFMY